MNKKNNTNPTEKINCCAVIPSFNHYQKMPAIVSAIRSHNIDIIIINDGSNKECRAALEALAQTDSQITIINNKHNTGKGNAVCKAFAIAHQQVYSHVLQIDADGQHNLADLPRFLIQAKNHPSSVISGIRDKNDMPASRAYGRQITDFWVWINTLSGGISDSMCGYRLYPLNSTINIIERFTIGSHMDFDTEILVRHHWQGTQIIQLKTKVSYDEKEKSNFHLLKDNIRISLMHTRLFFGMLIRIPKLINQNAQVINCE